ncbi:MAG: FAD-binding oxidoreductase [archaeon]
MNPKIAEIFGPVNAADSDRDLLAYSTDASRISGEAKMVLHPTRMEQIQKFVQYARRSGMNIVPRGAGTGIVGGAVPQGSIVLDMSKMSRILELREDYVVVEAGVIFSDVNDILKDRDLHIPVDSEINRGRTVGGMLATNAVGLRIMEHGRIEDWVEEVEIVDGTGHHVKLKRDEAKNFCGTEGIAGVIVRAKLRVLPVDKERSLSILSFNTITAMMEKVDELKQDSNVKMILYLDDTCSELLDLGSSIHLFVEYASGEGEITNGSEIAEAIGMVESLDGKLKASRRIIREDPRVPSSELPKFLNWLRKYNIPNYGNVDVGLIHPYFLEGSSYEISELYKVVKSIHGSVGWEHGLGLLKRDHASPERKRKLEILKKHYDPSGIMNKGKVL